MKLTFDNVTISGKGPATGKTTLYRNLKPYLSPLGWHFKTIGDIVREHLKDNIMPSAIKLTDEFDREIESSVEKILIEEKNWVVESWLAGFVARKLPNVLRVLLICKDDSLRVDRVANRDKISIEQAKQFLKQREDENLTKYKRLYGKYDFWDPKYYHLVIDTYENGQPETVQKVLDALGYKPSKI